MAIDYVSKRIRLILATKQFKKENLILVHGFSTNSFILKGFIDYLKDFFNVYPIDLPGFNKNDPSSSNASVKNYAEYVEQKIKELRINNYILAGVSFGFYIVNTVPIDKKCKGIFAMEPYTGIDGLKMATLKEKIYNELLKVIIDLNLSDFLWKNKYLPKILHLLTGHPLKEIGEIIDQIDAETFFKTAELILETHDECKFKEIPYILAINKNDNVIQYKYILNLFRKNAKHLFVMYTEVEHFPKEMTSKYFRERIKDSDMYGLIRWLNSISKQK